MRYFVISAVLVAAVATASDRGSLDFSFGGGAWIPGLLDSNSELEAGPGVALSIEIPMEMGDIIFLKTGYRLASTDRPGWDAVNAIPLVFGYRSYPFYRPYAGPRGLEPLIGIYGGGMLAWDSAESDSLETSTTGGGVIGLEIGARLKLSDVTFLDLIVSPEWIPMGGALAGEEKKDLSGLTIFAGIVF